MAPVKKRILILGMLYFTVTVAALTVTVIFNADWLSFIYLVLTLAGIYLNSLRIKEGLLIFAMASVFYTYINFINKFYGEFALYTLIACYYIVFYFKWKKRQTGNIIKSFKPFIWPICLVAGMVFVPVYMILLRHLGTTQPLVNSILTFLTCLAVIMTASTTWQQFIIWISINVAQMLLWLSTLSNQNLSYLSLIIMNIFLFFINIYNLITWLKIYKHQT